MRYVLITVLLFPVTTLVVALSCTSSKDVTHTYEVQCPNMVDKIFTNVSRMEVYSDRVFSAYRFILNNDTEVFVPGTCTVIERGAQ